MPTDSDVADLVVCEIIAGEGLSLGQAARRLPSARNGRAVSPSTVWRWLLIGVKLPGGRRVHLEGARISGRWLTSGPALARFIAAQTPDVDNSPQRPAAANAKRRASERAGAALAAKGL
jgi:hypothetical protein